MKLNPAQGTIIMSMLLGLVSTYFKGYDFKTMMLFSVLIPSLAIGGYCLSMATGWQTKKVQTK